MSSIVGFINLDRKPADQQLLLKLCRPLESRVTSSPTTCLRSHVGLAHGMLKISSDEHSGHQPCSLDESVWITSDEHIYGRPELLAKLKASGLELANEIADPELLLLAYATFGDQFAQHLIGDFAIAIWDESRQTLICARDHLGVRPFFYAHTKRAFVFASDIDSILEHPDVSAELNETYIADFLIFGGSIDNEATVYRQVKRLPASHYVKVGPRGVELCRYWEFSTRNAVRYADITDYIEHFRSVFELAVKSRVPAGSVAMELSGGMDSSSIAAVVAEHASRRNIQVATYTNTCQALIPADKEAHFVRFVSDHLKLPVKFNSSEKYRLFERFEQPILRTGEPFGNPGLAQHYDQASELIDSGHRVLLSGQMGDALFAGSQSYYLELIKTGRLARLIAELWMHYRIVGSLSGTGLGSAARSLVKGRKSRKEAVIKLPSWINQGFANRVDFIERWAAIWKSWNELNDAYSQLQSPWSSQIFESYEALKLPLVVRHPFSDIRLVKLMLAVPSYLHSNKRILRDAMKEKLPSEIISRPKEGLPGDLLRIKMERGMTSDFPPLDSVGEYIDVDKFLLAYGNFAHERNEDSSWNSCIINHPIALAYWVTHCNR